MPKKHFNVESEADLFQIGDFLSKASPKKYYFVESEAAFYFVTEATEATETDLFKISVFLRQHYRKKILMLNLRLLRQLIYLK